MASVEQVISRLDGTHTFLDALWAVEADYRLSAYRRGGIHALALSDVIAKHQVTEKP
jgi:hypothetical protein